MLSKKHKPGEIIGNALIQSTLRPMATDFGWVFDSRALDQRRLSELLRWLLNAANQ